MKGILTDDNGFVILAGGFASADIDNQCLKAIALQSPGHAGNSPYLGINLRKYINAPGESKVLNQLKRTAKLNMKLDGFEDREIDVKEYPVVRLKGKIYG